MELWDIVSRRGVVRALTTTGIFGVGLVLSDMYAARVGAEVHEVDARTEAELSAAGNTLVKRGDVAAGTFAPVQITRIGGTAALRPVLHPNKIAESLLLMGYMENARDGARTMAAFLHRHPLTVQEMPKDRRDSDEGATSSPAAGHALNILPFTHNDEHRVIMELNPDIFTQHIEPDILAHESYHVEEQARDGDTMTASVILGEKTAGTALRLLGAYAALKISRSLADRAERSLEARQNRRSLLQSVGIQAVRGGVFGAVIIPGVVAAANTGSLYDAYLSPEEAQAYLQGAFPDQLGALASQEPLKHTLSQIVTFDPV